MQQVTVATIQVDRFNMPCTLSHLEVICANYGENLKFSQTFALNFKIIFQYLWERKAESEKTCITYKLDKKYSFISHRLVELFSAHHHQIAHHFRWDHPVVSSYVLMKLPMTRRNRNHLINDQSSLALLPQFHWPFSCFSSSIVFERERIECVNKIGSFTLIREVSKKWVTYNLS